MVSGATGNPTKFAWQSISEMRTCDPENEGEVARKFSFRDISRRSRLRNINIIAGPDLLRAKESLRHFFGARSFRSGTR